MAHEELDKLLEFMPAIAEAVNAFNSETAQLEALAALLGAYGGKRPTLVNSENAHTEESDSATLNDASEAASPPIEKAPAKRQKRTNGSAARDGFKLVRDLDLNPSGKQSLAAFVAEKQPKSNEDKFAVTVYWLEHVAAMPAITFNHVGTAFRFMTGWREPADVLDALRVTQRRKGTVDVSKPDDITSTPHGRNFVEHD